MRTGLDKPSFLLYNRDVADMGRGVILSRSRPSQSNTLTAPLIRILAISATGMAKLMGGFVMVKEILLTRGAKALVDDVDADLAEHRWHCLPHGRTAYAARGAFIDGRWRTIRMHRVILARMQPDLPSDFITDHRDRDGLNNQRNNLRSCNQSQNQANMPKLRGTYSSRYKGVYWDNDRKRWIALLGVDGKQKYIGSFKLETDAARAYNNLARTHYGAFAFLNKVGRRKKTDTKAAPLLPRYGWLDRSEVYHDVRRCSPQWHGTYLYRSACGCVFIQANVGNESPAERRLCKWCERARMRDAAIAEYYEESDG